MNTLRSGSALLLSLGLAAIAAMVGFAFLRSTSRLVMSGPSEVLVGLARDAALSGVAHAGEQILLDYNAVSLPVATCGGAATVSAAPTFLDGPYRAPFVSFDKPNRLRSTQDGRPLVGDDVPEENHLLLPFIRKSKDSVTSWHATLGMMVYDGRGRYIEVGYANVSRPSPAVATPVPVAPLRFTDSAAAAPERSDGIFLDASLRRLTSGTAEQQRQMARYRLRYALGVEDLQGHLLSNPIADMDWDWQTPGNAYRQPPQWLDAAAYAWQNMTACSFNGSMATTALRMGHVFRGRGSATNGDRQWQPGDPRFGYPATFPMMFRSARETEPNDNYGRMHWAFFTYRGDDAVGVTGNPNRGGIIYRHVNTRDPRWAAIDPDADGGRILTPIGTRVSANEALRLPTYSHALMGPQLSWFSHYFSVQGLLQWGGTGNWSHLDGTDTSLRHWAYQRSRFLTVPSPFGRAVQAAAPATAWYHGKVQTPWLVNALTAAPQTVSQMLLGYLYPEVKQYHYNREYYYDKTGENTVTNADGTHTTYDVYTFSTAVAPNPAVVDIDKSGPGPLDLLNDQLGSGFADFPAPSTMLGAQRIKPDYYQDPPDPRPVAQRYPGPLCRGDSAVAGQGSDDLGKAIDTDAQGSGLCTHTGVPLIIYGTGDDDRYDLNGTVAPWRKRYIVTKVDPSVASMRHSYMWDLAYGFTQAIAFMRATWVQYPNVVFDPRSGFAPATIRDCTSYASAEALDRLLLRQLGENFADPGTRCPEMPILQTYSADVYPNFSITKSIRFQVAAQPVSHTIRSLVAGDLISTPAGVASAERGKVMERMLNDFRLSFLGASPQYGDDFRPLDFDGDGHVHCSAYEVNPAATADELTYKTARWKPSESQSHPALGALPGRGPALSALPVPVPAISDREAGFGSNPWFCATGCFFVGKSRYFRILCRGEVFDNQRNKPVAAQTLEAVLAVDPEAPLRPAAGRVASDSQVLFQRWHYNDSVSEFPNLQR